MQLPGPATALALRGRDAVAQPILGDRPRGGDRRRRAGAERRQEPLVLGAELGADRPGDRPRPGRRLPAPRKPIGTKSSDSASNQTSPRVALRSASPLSRSASMLRRTAPGREPSIGIRMPRRLASSSPAIAETTSSSSSGSRIASHFADTRARPRLTTVLRIRSRSVSPPTTRLISVIASRRCTARSSSSRCSRPTGRGARCRSRSPPTPRGPPRPPRRPP